MEEFPVQPGSMLFTMVDPHRGHEAAYNRWYERDHFYCGCMVGAWWFSGGRWVATRALKDLRFPESSAFAQPVDAGSFLSIYWVHEDHEQEAFDWAGEKFKWIYQNGRGFHQRTHAHTALYDLASFQYRDDDGVPLALALDHRFPGLAVVAIEPVSGTSTGELRASLEAEVVPDLLAAGPVASVSSWTVRGRPRPAGDTPSDPSVPNLATEGGTDDRLVQLCFLDVAPEGTWAIFRRYAQAVEDGGKGLVSFAAPFYGTVVGTDTYTDQLW
jgi:hypothetical protein